MDENSVDFTTIHPNDSLTEERSDSLADPVPDPLADHLNDRLEHVDARHAEARHEHTDLLPRPTCVTCFNPLDGIAGGWWCGECEQFD